MKPILVRVQTPYGGAFQKYGRDIFRLVREPEKLLTTGLLLYWGDFVNNLDYGLRDFVSGEARMSRSTRPEEALEQWKRFYLLSENLKGSCKVISVSNNFQALDNALKEVSADQARTISNLYGTSFDYVFPRDPISLEKFTRCLPKDHTVRTGEGVDAAFLMDRGPYLKQQLAHSDRRHFVWFFGRSLSENYQEILHAASVDARIAPLHLGRWLGLRRTLVHHRFKKMLHRIANARFVLTDTYHVAVNSLALGVPVICVGRATKSQEGTLGDFKKSTLFEMFKLSDYYVPISADHSNLELISEKSAQLSTAFESDRLNVLHGKVAAYREELRDAIFS